MKKYKPPKEEQKAVNRLKATIQKMWDRMHPAEVAMVKKAVELALPKSTRDFLARKANSKENIKAVKKFFDQVDSLKI